MSKFYTIGKYTQKEWDDGTFTCTCMHLTMEWSRNKDRAKIKPCRHIKEIMPLSKERIELLRKFVRYTCEECHKPESKAGILEPHKINQNLGYNMRNIKMACKRCHGIFSSAQRIAEGIQGRS